MLNYDKMDEVLRNLDNYVQNMKYISETQEKLEQYAFQINSAIVGLQTAQNDILSSVEAIKKIEETHNRIELNIESILQDYKKIHSAFEYVELEMKKTSSLIDSVREKNEENINGLKDFIELEMKKTSSLIDSAREKNEENINGLKDLIELEMKKMMSHIDLIKEETETQLQTIKKENEINALSAKRQSKNGLIATICVGIAILIPLIIGFFI